MKNKLACMAAVMALCGSVIAGAANYTILEKAEKVETTVYGSVQSGALVNRIDGLDQTLYGVKDTTSNNMEGRTDTVYKDVYGNEGSDLSMLAAVNLMQWKYAGQVTSDSLMGRMSAMEESILGKVGTGSLSGRIAALRKVMLNNETFVSTTVTLPADTVVHIKTLEPLNSKVNKKNDIVHFAIAEDVMAGEVVAIPKGMEFTGTVTDVRKAGAFGRDGKMTITYGSVAAVDGTPVPLVLGEKAKEEYKNTAGAVGASAAGAIILGPIGLVGGLFVKGSNVDLPQGTLMYVQTQTDTTVIGFTEKPSTSPSADRVASGVPVDGAMPAVTAVPLPTSAPTTVADTTAAAGVAAAPAGTEPATVGVVTNDPSQSDMTAPTVGPQVVPVEIGTVEDTPTATGSKTVVSVTPSTNKA